MPFNEDPNSVTSFRRNSNFWRFSLKMLEKNTHSCCRPTVCLSIRSSGRVTVAWLLFFTAKLPKLRVPCEVSLLGSVAPDVSTTISDLILRVKRLRITNRLDCFGLKMQAQPSSETSGTTGPATRCHIPKNETSTVRLCPRHRSVYRGSRSS